MPENEEFKFKEISEEVTKEYHQEKEQEEKQDYSEVEKEELTDSSAQAPAFTYQGKEELKKKEEDKKTVVKEKIKNLLRLAEEKGLQYSIKQAEKENDPFLLDLYHDVLAKNTDYKKYLKE
ncbi:MAG: hypothetical protein U9P61_01050 [Patescibacteria group bacterium]|nr:hypothetical protein [Patescibacteria group bacterium]